MTLVKIESNGVAQLSQRIKSDGVTDFNTLFHTLQGEALKNNKQISKGDFLYTLIKKFGTKVTLKMIEDHVQSA